MWKLLLNFVPGVGPFLSEGATLLGGIFTYIGRHWKVFAVLAMIGCIAYQNFEKTRFVFGLETIPHMNIQIEQDKKDIAGLKADLAVAVTANQKLTGDISSLNVVVGQWKSVSDKLQKQNDALQGTLDKQRIANNKKVQDILNGKTPVTCEDSIGYLRNEKGALTW
jgi:regulator of replication initiation timing